MFKFAVLMKNKRILIALTCRLPCCSTKKLRTYKLLLWVCIVCIDYFHCIL